MVGKIIQFFWLKVDADILCTLYEQRMNFFIEKRTDLYECENNQGLMTKWVLVDLACIGLKWIIDIYFAYKLNQYS